LDVSSRAALLASIALLTFSTLTTIALVGWFYQAESTWTWQAVVTLVCVIFALVLSALMWVAPTRARANMGGAVLLASLARIGLPQDWTWRSFALVAVTLVLLLPLVHAAIVLRNNAE
jgi:hypothetical protein